MLSVRLNICVFFQASWRGFFWTVTFFSFFKSLLPLWWSHTDILEYRAVLKKSIRQYITVLFLWYLYCVVTHVSWYVSYWSPCQNPALKFSDTKELSCTLLSCFQFQCVQLKCKSSLQFHFSFWCYGSYIHVFGNFVIFQHHSNKLERTFWIKMFWLCQLNYQYNVMWCIKTTQIVHGNLHLFSHFQWTILIIAIYCNMNHIVICIVSWTSCQYPALVPFIIFFVESLSHTHTNPPLC